MEIPYLEGGGLLLAERTWSDMLLCPAYIGLSELNQQNDGENWLYGLLRPWNMRETFVYI